MLRPTILRDGRIETQTNICRQYVKPQGQTSPCRNVLSAISPPIPATADDGEVIDLTTPPANDAAAASPPPPPHSLFTPAGAESSAACRGLPAGERGGGGADGASADCSRCHRGPAHHWLGVCLRPRSAAGRSPAAAAAAAGAECESEGGGGGGDCAGADGSGPASCGETAPPLRSRKR